MASSDNSKALSDDVAETAVTKTEIQAVTKQPEAVAQPAETVNENVDEVREMIADAVSDLNDENPDKVDEYFQTKNVIRTLRSDLKDIKANHPDALEIEKLNKQLKQLRERVKNTEEVKILTEKIATLTERLELIKEIIRVELIQLEKEEVKHEGKKLKLVQILKEMKDEEES